jgi:hypothetical protein
MDVVEAVVDAVVVMWCSLVVVAGGSTVTMKPSLLYDSYRTIPLLYCNYG